MIRLILGLLMAVCLQGQQGLAATLSLTPTAAHEPNENNSTFHRLGYNLTLAFSHYALHLGGTHPYKYRDFQEQIAWTSFVRRYSKGRSGFQPFMDIGAGVWANYVAKGNQSYVAYVPSLLTHGGMRYGGSSFGIEGTISTYFGVLRPTSLASWYAWPLMNLGLGIYAAL